MIAALATSAIVTFDHRLLKMEASNNVHSSLPANYLTLLDMRERWMQQRKQKKRDEDSGGEELQRNFVVRDDLAAEGEDEGAGDYNKIEQQHQPPEKPLLRSNPKSSTRRLSHSDRHPTGTRNCRWVQVSQPNKPHVLPLNEPKQAQTVRALQPKQPPAVQIVETKSPQVMHVSRSKQPPLDSPKVESQVETSGEIRSSGKTGEGEEEKKKKKKKKAKKRHKSNKKRNDEKKDVVQSQQENGFKQNPEQGFEVGRGNQNADDNARGEIQEKLGSLSLSSGTGKSSGGKSMAVRNGRGLGKKEGGYGRFEGKRKKERGYGKFEGKDMLMKERAKGESGLVWVKKGASQIDAVQIDEADSMRG